MSTLFLVTIITTSRDYNLDIQLQPTMSDLDDDLLALAGISDSEEETSPKKRKVIDDSDEDEQLEAEELVVPYPLENKYKDEQDRENLLLMDEMAREEILFERSQEMERFNEKKFLQERAKQQQAQATRSSKRSKGGKTARSDKLSELRKQREQKTRKDDYLEDEEEEDEEEEDIGLEDEEEEPLSDYDEGEVVWGSKTRKTKSYARGKLEDVNKVLVGRSFLHKYCFYPEFTDVVLDCFSRVNLGMDKRTRQPMYRMVKIVDVQHVPDKRYKLPNFESDLYLLVSQNRDQTKLFPINVFSDSPIMEDEYNRYLKELEKTNEEIDYVDDINDKYETIQTLVNKNLTDKDINEIIEKKQQTMKTLNGYDAVYKKARLMDRLKITQQQGNKAEFEKVKHELKEMENLLLNSSNKTNNSQLMSSMSKVNERNRKLNSENIRKAELKSSIMRKSTDNDPYQKLKQVSKGDYQEIINLENEKAQKDAKLNYSQMIKQKSDIENKISKSTYRVLGVMDKLINDIDIDIDISV